MSASELQAEDRYEAQEDSNVEVSGIVSDNDYASRTGQKDVVPVDKDADVTGPTDQGDQDSDAQLQKDDKDAIDEGNIISERTRGAKPSTGEYNEGPEEDDLPDIVARGDAGNSNTA